MNQLEQTNAAPVPGRLGQGTAVEQSRAVAEVQAAIVVAQQCPRSLQAAVAMMRESCQQRGLAERAFYRYSRGGQTVTGASVHLARELARCWGNLQYGLAELRRDDEYGESEMQAWAWDVQTNTRSSQTFIVPHKRDVKGGPKKLVDLRDIYENNANNGARRLREAIFSILPPWFSEEAKELCDKTLQDGGGRPLPRRIADAVALFEGLGVALDRMEQNIGRPSDKWTVHDVVKLGTTYKSVQRGEIALEDEFPPERLTVAEVQRVAAPAPATPVAAVLAGTPGPAQPVEAAPTPEADSFTKPLTPWQESWEKVVGEARRLEWDKDRTYVEFQKRNNFPVSESSNEHLNDFAEYLQTLAAAGVA